MIEALFFIPVGPNDVERAVWTVQSIRAYCVDYRIHLILDGPDASSLPAALAGPDIRVRSQTPPTKGHWGKVWLMQCLAMCEALEDPNSSPHVVFVKIDADALVLRPGLAERAQRIFATRPSAGQIGQCFSNVRGGRLHNRGWARFMSNMLGWRGLYRFLSGAKASGESWWTGFEAFCDFRKLLGNAVMNGYSLGEFAVGGSYILRKDVLAVLSSRGFLERPPTRLLPRLGEDVVMTPHVYAAGYAAIDNVSDGGIFAVEGKAFRVDPFTLKARGHYIIHPAKYGHQAHGHSLDEAQLISSLMGA